MTQPRVSHPYVDMRYRENGIEHRLTEPGHPWTNGQVERMNRTLKEATVRCNNYETPMSSRAPRHLPGSLQLRKAPQNIARSHPYEFICKRWTESPDKFRLDPTHHKLGLNT